MQSTAYAIPMGTSRRFRFVRIQVGWMLAVLVSLTVFDALTLELFFSSSLMGLLVLFEMTEPRTITPPWRVLLRRIALVGLVVYGLIVVRRVSEMLPPGVI